MACTVQLTTKSGTAPAEAVSIAIPVMPNLSGNGPSSLSQDFTEYMRDYFQSNTKLEISPQLVPGELRLVGTITGYTIRPVSGSVTAQGLEQAAQNRLTMFVKVNYENPFNKKDNFDRSFDYFKDFDGDKSLSEVEAELLEEIYEQLAIKIFNKSFDNW
jgi:hypothetical protein